jgi:Flp pilus assembly protein TadD
MTNILRPFILTAALLSFQAASPAAAMDSNKVQTGAADLTKARALIKAKNWKDAEAELLRLEKLGPNADVYNLLGFSIRKQGRFDPSYAYYMKALKLDPNHKSAHEYLGELYLQQGNLAGARKQAATLAKLCPQGCEEREDLDRSIAAYKP